MTERREWIFTVDGMTCDHCARIIDGALRAVPGVIESSTTHPEGRTRVVATAYTAPSTIASAIRDKGFSVTRQEDGRARGAGGRDDDELDLLVIGAGSAGFAAAIRAQELGARVAIVERGALGGTCVNVGCVPSKTLIRAAEVRYHATHHGFAGIRFDERPADFGAIIDQKRRLVAELQQAKYSDVLASYPSIMLMNGSARFRSDGIVEVDGQPVHARKVLLAMGSSAWLPRIAGLAEASVLTSTELMDLDDLPGHLVVLGGGYVGLELGQAFARLGSRVTVLARSRLLSHEDEEIGTTLATYLRAEGIDVRTNVRIDRVSGGPGSFRVSFSQDGGSRTAGAEQVLVATGRRPSTRGMGLEEAGIRLGNHGEVRVDEHLETSRPNVYAAGDVTGEPAFVYVAAYAGNLAADNALSGNGRAYDVSVVPRVTFTDPAVASVGLTEARARERGIDVRVSVLPMRYVPRAIAARDTRGLVKLVADAKTNLLVGAHILAPEAGDIIQQAAMAIRFGIRVDDIAAMLHPYLTNAEAMKLACQAFSKDVAKLSCCAA